MCSDTVVKTVLSLKDLRFSMERLTSMDVGEIAYEDSIHATTSIGPNMRLSPIKPQGFASLGRARSLRSAQPAAERKSTGLRAKEREYVAGWWLVAVIR